MLQGLGARVSRREEATKPPKRRSPIFNLSTRQRYLIGGVAACSLVLTSLFLPTLIGGWAPLLHWSCVDGQRAVSQAAWVPAILVNAPYRGNVSGNATIPPGFIADGSGFGSGDGMPASNGSVGGVFFHLWLSLFALVNSTVLGPGLSSRCTGEWGIMAATDFNGSQVFSGILGNQGNLSDANEPASYNLTAEGAGVTARVDNGFVRPNSPDVSTCGESSNVSLAQSLKFTVSISFSVAGRVLVLPYILPFKQTFQYRFPADGIWVVDNLSAPGGPGGGWAFSYSPCP